MPRPVPASRSSPSRSPSQSSAPSRLALIHHATDSSTQCFTQHATSVLKHSFSSFLKRRLSQKIHDQLRDVPYEALKNCDSASVVSTFFHSPLEISEQDVADCEEFAERVAYRWEKALRRRGYVEFADVLLSLVEEGSFLQMSNHDEERSEGAEPPVATNEDPEECDSLTSKFITLYAALNSLRRYQPDCDSSGRPFENIPSLSGHDSDGPSSARRVIQQIDRLMQSIDSKELKARYGYDWDAINEAVRRNEKRLYINQRSAEHEDDEYEVVPKMYAQMVNYTEDSDVGIHGSETLHREKVVQFKEGSNLIHGNEENESVNTQFLISTHPKTASVLRRKRYREEYNQYHDGRNTDELREMQKGRPPSTIADTQWTWQDILDDIPILERQKLIRGGIHPPFPAIENGDENQMDIKSISEREGCASHSDAEDTKHAAADVETHSAVICGALRSFGSTHLWEQTCNCPLNKEHHQTMDLETQQLGNVSEGWVAEDTISDAAEDQKTFQCQRLLQLQKRTLRRAIKERIAPRSLILSDMKSEYADGLGKNNRSRAKWTEGCQEIDGRRESNQHIDESPVEEIPTQQVATSTTPSELWLEMDLGECTIEILDDNHEGEAQTEGTPKKRMLAFRSLELALRF
ncbi:hypothetical protein ACHAW6_010066 [Cyclotella cf. meneghiniana]